jgi:hypothetical protein
MVEISAPLVLQFNYNAVDQELAPGVFRSGRRDSAPMFFHSGHLVPGDVLASYRFSHEVNSA